MTSERAMNSAIYLSALAKNHIGNDHLGEVNDREDIQLEQLLGAGDLKPLRQRALRSTRVEHENVNASERGENRVIGSALCLVVGHIERQHVRPQPLTRVGHLLELSHSPRRHHDLSSLLRQVSC